MHRARDGIWASKGWGFAELWVIRSGCPEATVTCSRVRRAGRAARAVKQNSRQKSTHRTRGIVKHMIRTAGTIVVQYYQRLPTLTQLQKVKEGESFFVASVLTGL